MTKALSPSFAAEIIAKSLPDAVTGLADGALWVKSGSVLEVARLLKDSPELDLNFLSSVTGIDWYPTHFEVVYHLVSLTNNHGLVLKTKTADRANPVVPSVVSVWCGANLQEREVYDLMGISFAGHPNLKRVLLWDEFEGHPLRKDFVPGSR